VEVPHRLVDVAVLLRGAGRGHLGGLEAVVDDRLEQVQGADHVRHDGLVRPVPRLAHVRLGCEMEDVRAIRLPGELAYDPVDRMPVGEVAPMDGQVCAQVRKVVERAARRRADERMDVGADPDERLGEV
jgi:hypothetical protein